MTVQDARQARSVRSAQVSLKPAGERRANCAVIALLQRGLLPHLSASAPAIKRRGQTKILAFAITEEQAALQHYGIFADGRVIGGGVSGL